MIVKWKIAKMPPVELEIMDDEFVECENDEEVEIVIFWALLNDLYETLGFTWKVTEERKPTPLDR